MGFFSYQRLVFLLIFVVTGPSLLNLIAYYQTSSTELASSTKTTAPAGAQELLEQYKKSLQDPDFCTSCPAEDTFSDTLKKYYVTLNEKALQSKVEREKAHGRTLVKGAGLYLNMVYGSCMNGISFSNEKQVPELWQSGVKNRCNISINGKKYKILRPTYEYGSTLGYHEKELAILEKSSSGLESRVDCSDFVVTSSLRMGARFYANSDEPENNTSLMFDSASRKVKTLGDENEKCLQTVKISGYRARGGGFLLPGDMLVKRDNHVVMIDHIYVGYENNPFGLDFEKDIQNEKDCNNENINPDAFKFDIIHSGPSPSYSAPTRLTAAFFCEMEPRFCQAIKQLAIMDCKARYAKNEFTEANVRFLSSQTPTALVRHNPNSSNCVNPNPPQFEYEDQCAGECHEQ